MCSYCKILRIINFEGINSTLITTETVNLKQILKSWLLIALGVLIASNIFEGIRYTDQGALLTAVLLLSLSNVFLKPLLLLFALPFIILSFGLGIWLINALLFLLVANLVDGFSVDSLSYALAGAFIVSMTGAFANILFGKNRLQVHASYNANGRKNFNASRSNVSRKSLNDDDIIDI